MIEETHAVTTVGMRLDPSYLALGFDPGGLVLRNFQLIQIQRVLRMIITADVAFATESTALLFNAEFVQV